MDAKIKLYTDLLEEYKPKPVFSTPQSVIGGVLGLVGFAGSLYATDRMKSFNSSTRDTQDKFNQILPEFNAKMAKEEANLSTDLGNYATKTEANVKQGMINRGLTDPAMGQYAAGDVKSGLSGAYATAKAALSKAKINASSAVSGAINTYQQELTKKQYESLLSKYAAKTGIWGSLGGAGASILKSKSGMDEKGSK